MSEDDSIRRIDEFPLEDSLCYGCAFRMSKTVVPIDLETFGLNEEDYGIDDDEELQLEIHTCLILEQDMDYVVRACSHYSSNVENNEFFSCNPYTK